MLFQAIQIGIGDALLMQHAHSRASAMRQLVQIAKQDGLGWTGFRAGRLHAILLAVIAKRAFPGPAIFSVKINHAKGARRDAIAAAVADVRLNIDIAKFVADNRAGGAGIHTAGMLAMLAYIAHHQPAIAVHEAAERALIGGWRGYCAL